MGTASVGQQQNNLHQEIQRNIRLLATIEQQSTGSNQPLPTNPKEGSTDILSMFQTIIYNEQVLAKSLITANKGIQEIFRKLSNIEEKYWSQRPRSSGSVNSTSSLSFDFKKIDNEKTLNEFEAEIGDDVERARLVQCFVNSIGKNHRDLTHRNIALLLDSKLFSNSFWSTTAWTGGRATTKDAPNKFAFSHHLTIRSFIIEIITEICGSVMSDTDLCDFVKSRSRNSSYVRKTDRMTAARKKRKIDDVKKDENDEDFKHS